MELSTDVFEESILPVVPFSDIYNTKAFEPNIYWMRVYNGKEIFLKLLVAVAHDDVDLFRTIWPTRPRRVFDIFIVNLVVNGLTDPEAIVVPYEIFLFLLQGEPNEAMVKRLRADYDLVVTLLLNQDLIQDIVNYAASRKQLGSTYWSELNIDLTIDYADSVIRTDNLQVYVFEWINTILIGDLIKTEYPMMIADPPLDITTRNTLLDRREKFIALYHESNRSNGLYENIRFLGATVDIKTHNVNAAKLWYDALFIPYRYFEIVAWVDNERSRWNLFFETVEGTIVRPDLFVDAVILWANQRALAVYDDLAQRNIDDDVDDVDDVDDEGSDQSAKYIPERSDNDSNSTSDNSEGWERNVDNDNEAEQNDEDNGDNEDDIRDEQHERIDNTLFDLLEGVLGIIVEDNPNRREYRFYPQTSARTRQRAAARVLLWLDGQVQKIDEVIVTTLLPYRQDIEDIAISWLGRM
jgi:hypothetical protein